VARCQAARERGLAGFDMPPALYVAGGCVGPVGDELIASLFGSAASAASRVWKANTFISHPNLCPWTLEDDENLPIAIKNSFPVSWTR
jgi:hypothetical protein